MGLLAVTGTWALVSLLSPGLRSDQGRLLALLANVGTTGVADWVLAFGPLSPVVYSLVMVAQVILSPIPASPVTLAGALVFGVAGGAAMSLPLKTFFSLSGAHPYLPLFHHLAGADRALFQLVNGAWTHPLLDRAMPALSTSGDLGVVWIALLGAMAAFGKETGRRVALAGLVAFVIGFAASELIKEATSRPRPFAVLTYVRPLVPEPGSFAFPSGHTTSAFAAASGAVLAARRLLGRVPPWGWGMLALAAAISYSASTSACTGRPTWRRAWSWGSRAAGPAPASAPASSEGRKPGRGRRTCRPRGRRGGPGVGAPIRLPVAPGSARGTPGVRPPDRGRGAESAPMLPIVGTTEAGGTTCGVRLPGLPRKPARGRKP